MSKPLTELPASLAIPPVKLPGSGAPFELEVTPPGSKSLTNRALLLAALAKGTSVIRGSLRDGDDAVQMCAALRKLGATIEERASGEVAITGVGGRWRVGAGGVTLHVNGAGTAARFLAGAAILADGPVTIDGNPRLRERPMGQLGEALEHLGASVEYFGARGCAPVRIVPPASTPGLGDVLDIQTTQSSQFISALLLVAPWLGAPLTLRLTGPITSSSYIAMTLGLLGRLGATVQYSDNMRVLRVAPPRDGGGPGSGLRPFAYDVEPDASGATPFWGAAAITPGGLVRVVGLADDSLQGDADFPLLLERMGARVHRAPISRGSEGAGAPERFIEVRGTPALKPIFADMADMPDAIMTLAVVASFAPGTSIIRGVRTLRHKESDRVAALIAELGKLGVRVVCPVSGDDDVMTVTPPQGGVLANGDGAIEFETHDDHRLAMSLALIGLRRPGVSIREPRCVEKTYPDYWRHFGALYE